MTDNLKLFVFLLVVASVTSAAPRPAAAQWIPLFDGQTLDGWTTRGGQSVTKGWEVVDGAIHLNRAAGRGGDILTDREYDDFELLFQWKIAPGGNSGLKYRVRDFGGKTLGCEYQILGEPQPHPPNKGSTGSLYELYAPMDDMPLNPPGQFNQSRVVVRGNHIEHWLNGTQIVAAEVGSPEWRERLAASKFADADGFGEPGPGKIMLTDHGSDVWYRNIFLMPLSTGPQPGTICCQPRWCAAPRCRLGSRSHRPRLLFPRLGCAR